MKVWMAFGAVALVVAALPSAAQAGVLYSTLEAPNDVQGVNAEFAQNTQRIAQAFTPTTGGTARVVSLFGQTLLGAGAGTVQLSIHANAAGQPGAVLATGSGTIGEETGASPTCMVLGAAPALSTAQTYWAVFRGVNKGANWLFSRQQARQVLFSPNSGATWAQGGTQKTLSLRVEDNPACGPDISPNPVPGVALADMYAAPGGTSFQTVFIGNGGNRDLTLTGASFSGPNAGSFRLLRGEPTGPDNQPYAFPRTIGASSMGGELLYVVCDGALPDGTRGATLTLTSNDPDEASLSWPVLCIVDATPPSIEFTQNPTGLLGWHVVAPADLQARGIDPESDNRVKRIFCTDTAGPFLDFDAGSITTFHLTGDGTHQLSCRATDVANNTSAVGLFPATVKLDTQPPQTAKGTGPPDATSATSAQFAFTASDATSGVAGTECRLDAVAFAACTSPATRAALADGLHTFSVRARDIAGNLQAAATTWSWRVDTVPPDTTAGGGPAAVTAATSATFTLAGSDPGGSGVARIQCSLDGAAYADCPAPATYAGLAEGHHVLAVRAVDAAANVDPTPAVRAWDIDRTAPTARVASGPAIRTAATTATFTFAGDGAGAAPNASFECRIDDAAFATCASPLVATGLGEGDHRLDVRAVDTLGNVQGPPTAFTWTISKVPLAVDDRAATTGLRPVDVDVLANDIEPSGGVLSVLTFTGASANGGTVTATPGGLRYAPAAGFVGSDTFTYRVRNADGLESDPATVTVDVAATAPDALAPGGSSPGDGSGVLGVVERDRAAPIITKVRAKGRRLRFRMSEAARVTIRVERLAKGRKQIVKRAGGQRAGRAGSNRMKLPKRLRSGRYRVTITAIDAAGNRSARVRKRFRVSR